jgi:hypothetical protein
MIGLKREIDVFVALDFNKDKLLGVFFWVREVRDPQQGTFSLVVLKLFKILIIAEIVALDFNKDKLLGVFF